jgi:hypothetical protein
MNGVLQAQPANLGDFAQGNLDFLVARMLEAS